MIDAFINDHLISYVDTSAQPWKWRADFGLDPSALAAFEQARRIRDDLFPGGQGPVMSFTLEPKDLSPNVTRVTLNLDGQNLVYFNNATRPQPMTWPGKDGTGVISLAFQPIDGSPEIMLNETGSWAWLRMLRAGRFTGTVAVRCLQPAAGHERHVRRFQAQGGERREPLQPPDVQEILMSAADMNDRLLRQDPGDRRFRRREPAARSSSTAGTAGCRWSCATGRTRVNSTPRTWRFAIQAGIFGDQPCAGAWRMSQDRVGRRYPFAIVRHRPAAGAGRSMVRRGGEACRDDG